jgi:hypothetical protein
MDLCKRMARTRVKGNGSKAASSPSTEPNFYVMEPCQASAQPMFSEDLGQDDLQVFVTIEDVDTAKEITDDEEVVRLQMKSVESAETMSPFGESRAYVPCTPPHSPREERSESFSSTPPPVPSAPSSSSLPIVSPFEARALVSPPSSPQLISRISIPCVFPVGLEEDIHSGDQVFFEGLPFHYLETKDVEDSLLVRH